MTLCEMVLQIGLCKNIDTNEYEICKNTRCYFCEFATCSIDTYIYSEKKIVKTCILCHTISNFKTYYVYNVMLCHSDKSQSDIIKLTHDYYKKHNKIPVPFDIDKNVRRINLDCITFAHFYDQYYRKDKYAKFIFFFTSEIKMHPKQSLFKQITEHKSTYDSSIFDIPVYKMSHDEMRYIDEYISECKDANKKVMNKVKNEIDKKILATKKREFEIRELLQKNIIMS